MSLVKFFYWCLMSISICKDLYELKAMILLYNRQQIQSQKTHPESLQHWLRVPQNTIRMAYGNEMWMTSISTDLSMSADKWHQKASLDLAFYFHCKTSLPWGWWLWMECWWYWHVAWHNTAGLGMGRRMSAGCIEFNMLSLDQLANSKDEQLSVFFFCISTENCWAGFRENPKMLTSIGKIEVSHICFSTENSFMVVRIKLIMTFSFSFHDFRDDG